MKANFIRTTWCALALLLTPFFNIFSSWSVSIFNDTTFDVHVCSKEKSSIKTTILSGQHITLGLTKPIFHLTTHDDKTFLIAQARCSTRNSIKVSDVINNLFKPEHKVNKKYFHHFKQKVSKHGPHKEKHQKRAKKAKKNKGKENHRRRKSL